MWEQLNLYARIYARASFLPYTIDVTRQKLYYTKPSKWKRIIPIISMTFSNAHIILNSFNFYYNLSRQQHTSIQDDKNPTEELPQDVPLIMGNMYRKNPQIVRLILSAGKNVITMHTTCVLGALCGISYFLEFKPWAAEPAFSEGGILCQRVRSKWNFFTYTVPII